MAVRPAALCLTCSSSPSPKAQTSAPFITGCCRRPICEMCLTKNPRLKGYNPCLACLAGVAVVDQSRIINGKSNVPGPSGQSQDQEEGMFVLGDSDEEEDELIVAAEDHDAPPAYSTSPETASTVTDKPLVDDSEMTPEGKGANPPQYYIQPGDTLRGIALRYGLDGRKLCQLNSLPVSTLSTTPHLLHTRTRLTLPPTQRPLPPPPDPKFIEARNRERAEKRFQFVTKEIDWRVAKAYVALAEDEDDGAKTKEGLEEIKKKVSRERVLEAKAVDQYLDDVNWEAAQSEGSHIQGFPPFTVSGMGKSTGRVTLGAKLSRLIRP